MTTPPGLGWDRMEGSWWPAIAAGLPTTGKGWPEEAAAFDLRWWAGQGRATAGQLHQVAMPSARALARRWGWGKDRALTLLEAAWSDPFFHSQDGMKTVENKGVDPTTTRQSPDNDPTTTRQSPDSAGATNAANPEKNRQSPDNDPTTTRQSPDSDPTVEPGSLSMIARAFTDTDTDTDTGGENTPLPLAAPEPPPAPPEPPAVCVSPAPRLQLVLQEPEVELPPWTVSTPAYKCISRRQQAETVLRLVEHIHQRGVNPVMAKTAALEVLRLWRHLEWQAPEAFEADVELVSRACRLCPDELFRGHVRGLRLNGARWRRDSSREADTVCRLGSFGKRLQAARLWALSGCPPDAGPTSERPEPPRGVYPTPPPKTPEQLQKEQDDFDHLRAI